MVHLHISGQNFVSVTIDDVPNTRLYEQNGFSSDLMHKLDSLNIPVTLFVNEGLLYKTDHVEKNTQLLETWAGKNYVSLANHTFSHSRYSKVGLDSFINDIEKGNEMLTQLAKKNDKSVRFFRFTYNDLGKDSAQHTEIRYYLKKENYEIAPFSVESADWLYNTVYLRYLENGQKEEARKIGEDYVKQSLRLFHYFDSLSLDLYGRKIKHIYLCHDNRLNADYLPDIIHGLKRDGYTFISLDEAAADPVYNQPDRYYKKWGISWIYRLMADKTLRNQLMRQEPSDKDIFEIYRKITK
jgi:peptidoglycan/xylan/chitin deacetylase (PgdA/CDA1 family)